jgi:hypothetical protein
MDSVEIYSKVVCGRTPRGRLNYPAISEMITYHNGRSRGIIAKEVPEPKKDRVTKGSTCRMKDEKLDYIFIDRQNKKNSQDHQGSGIDNALKA